MNVHLKVVVGPMKGAKSLELIADFAPLQYARVEYGLFQPALNVRDEGIWSRNRIKLEARKIHSLCEILADKRPYRMVGIDEIHMFNPEDVNAIDELLRQGTSVVVSGLDMDYRGKLYEIVRRILELSPDQVSYKMAVCEVCRCHNCAKYTQVYHRGQPVTSGLPSIIPDDGTYQYSPVCRNCFVKEE